RIEGVAPSVTYRSEKLHKLFAGLGTAELLQTDISRALWREIRDCKPFADSTPAPVWRVSMAPTAAHQMVAALRMEAGVNAFYDWQGGLVWLRMEADPEADILRSLIARFGGGHATLVRAPAPFRASLPVFQPQPPALA